MSKTVEITLTRTVKIGGQYRSPGETVEVARKQALEILAARAGYEQPGRGRAPEKAGKKPKEEGGNAQSGDAGDPAGDGQGDDASGQDAG